MQVPIRNFTDSASGQSGYDPGVARLNMVFGGRSGTGYLAMETWAMELFGLGAISMEARTTRLLEAVGILLLLLGIGAAVRFWKRAANWKKEGLFTRPIPPDERLPAPERPGNAEEEPIDSEDLMLVAARAEEIREMSRNRKD